MILLLAGCSAGEVAVSSPAAPTTAATDGVLVEVTGVVDGDTVEIAFPNGSTDTVRLLGVDTPEVHAENEPAEFEGVPDTDAGADCLRAAGHDATAFLAERVRGRRVRLVVDPVADRRGGYGRLLAYLFADGTNLNYRLVARGHARVYDSVFAKSESFYAAEERAREAGRGLWACRSAGTATAAGRGYAVAGSPDTRA